MKFSAALALSILSVASHACPDQATLFKPFVVTEYAQEAVLNGNSIQLYKVVAPSCDLNCYISYLKSKGYESVVSGSVLSIVVQNQFVSYSLDPSSKKHFKANVTCSSDRKIKKLNIPLLPLLQRPKSDFQVKDGLGLSRTIVYDSVSRSRFNLIVSTLKARSSSSEFDGTFYIFKMKNDMEVTLSFDTARLTAPMIAVFQKRM